VVTFTIKNKAGEPLAASDLDFLNLVLAGPTTDYRHLLIESARNAQCSGGACEYTFQQPLPADAAGTYTIGIEGYRNATLLPGTVTEMTVRDVGENKTIDFAVDNSPVMPRRQVVAEMKCNNCHFQLAAHGTIRNQVEHCVLCHNPTATDAERRPAEATPPEAIDFRLMVHRIHTGEEQQSPYVVYGFNRQPVSFDEVRFPGDRQNCEECHVNGSQELPVAEGLIQVTNPRGFINPEGPATAACTGCHTGVEAASHALANTTTLGESCSACHGADREFSVGRVHAR
jgi:OmcA/MtrC family decaheme c-type cytochrome